MRFPYPWRWCIEISGKKIYPLWATVTGGGCCGSASYFFMPLGLAAAAAGTPETDRFVLLQDLEPRQHFPQAQNRTDEPFPSVRGDGKGLYRDVCRLWRCLWLCCYSYSLEYYNARKNRLRYVYIYIITIRHIRRALPWMVHFTFFILTPPPNLSHWLSGAGMPD